MNVACGIAILAVGNAHNEGWCVECHSNYGRGAQVRNSTADALRRAAIDQPDTEREACGTLPKPHLERMTRSVAIS